MANILLSDQIFSDLSSAQTLTVPTEATQASVQAQAGNLRFRVGATPTTSVGGIIFAGSWHVFRGNLDRIQLIELDSGAKGFVIYHDVDEAIAVQLGV